MDDVRADKIVTKLPKWGESLFHAVFSNINANRLFLDFYVTQEQGRLLTIAEHPAILSLPWELLCVDRKHLFHENPRISIRRRFSGAGGPRSLAKVKTRDRLRLLFVVSRPEDAAFIDPRSDPMAVMDALEAEEPGRVDVEFLRPATLDNLVKRLERKSIHRKKPAVDILHFDGHGVFDPDGRFHETAWRNNHVVQTRIRGESGANTGYLMFENVEGKKAPISAETLGNMFNNQSMGLVVLSACQSAKLGEEEAMGCVAARLTHAGVPAVLAMTHTVLVDATRVLFGSFYEHLAYGQGVGESLDDARRHLYMHPERGERQRGRDDRITLQLHDWFLPALYQAGKDVPLLTDSDASSPEPEPWGNLPKLQEAGFFGRTRELWEIERRFVQGTRRITVSGFGGQGKTYLAIEAGDWLHRTGMFERVCFVAYDSYQGVDPVGIATSILSTVLNESLIDAAAAEVALEKCSTLVILDNLESLHRNQQQEILTAAASWSRAGNRCVLLTTRQPNSNHPHYPVSGSHEHHRLILAGLSETDAVNYFQALMKLPPDPLIDPPKRVELENLFEMVDFHPLSIGLLANALKFRTPDKLGERLEVLLAESPEDAPDRSLLASLTLSLDRLDDEARKWLPRLGVFHGGAMEDVLLQVTGLGQTDEDPDITKSRQLLEAYENGDPLAILRTADIELPEGLELSEKQANKLYAFAIIISFCFLYKYFKACSISFLYC